MAHEMHSILPTDLVKSSLAHEHAHFGNFISHTTLDFFYMAQMYKTELKGLILGF